MNKRQWIKYGALLMLAVVAFGLAGLALVKQRGPTEAANTATAAQPAVTQTATAAPTPTQTAAVVQQPRIQLPAEPVVLILGDSYTAGVGADEPEQGWAYVVAGFLGFPTNIEGVPGTGFAWGGGAQDDLALEYGVRLQKIADDPTFIPNVLILQGGQNDSLIGNPDEIQSATAATIESARKFWPGVQVVVLGPSAPQPFAEELRDTNTAVRAGAAAAKAPFIDASESGWFTAANSERFNFDGSHVNTAGHRYIAEKFLESWTGLTQ